jgi:hypothetical protein
MIYNMSALSFMLFGDIADVNQDLTEYLNYFQEHYFPDALYETHYSYLMDLQGMREELGRFPTQHEFFMFYRTDCICQHSVSDDEYVLAASFFMREIGHIELSCFYFYTHAQYYMIERRHPSAAEFDGFIRRLSAVELSNDPNLDILNEPIVRPVEQTKLDELKTTICTLDGETCSICQEDIHLQRGVQLNCGHSFHADEKDCCENGTIFTWFSTNRGCPVCRKEII